MLEKFHNQHKSNKNYLQPKADISLTFGLNHFAGVVFYDCKGFLEKNRDTFSPDLLSLIQSSTNKYLVHLFDQDISMVSVYMIWSYKIFFFTEIRIFIDLHYMYIHLI